MSRLRSFAFPLAATAVMTLLVGCGGPTTHATRLPSPGGSPSDAGATRTSGPALDLLLHKGDLLPRDVHLQLTTHDEIDTAAQAPAELAPGSGSSCVLKNVIVSAEVQWAADPDDSESGGVGVEIRGFATAAQAEAQLQGLVTCIIGNAPPGQGPERGTVAGHPGYIEHASQNGMPVSTVDYWIDGTYLALVDVAVVDGPVSARDAAAAGYATIVDARVAAAPSASQIAAGTAQQH